MKVGHLLFHEAAMALRVVSVGVLHPGPVPTTVSTLTCATLLPAELWGTDPQTIYPAWG